jgi:hypothetical protein
MLFFGGGGKGGVKRFLGGDIPITAAVMRAVVGVSGKVCSIGVFESMKEFKKRQIKLVFASELLKKDL